MRRQAIVLLTMIWLLGIAPGPGGHAWAASEGAILRAVTISASPTGQELVMRVDGSYTYRSVQAAPDAQFIDLVGARLGSVPRSAVWANPLISGYKLLQYEDAAGESVVRVQVDTKQISPFAVQREGSTLRLTFAQATSSLALAAPTVNSPSTSPATAPTHATLPAPTSGPVQVSNVTIARGESGGTSVEVTTSGKATYRVTRLPTPPRLVVDIDGARDAAPQRSYAGGTLVLRDVRIGQFREKDPAMVRVVADLNGDPAFDVHSTPAGVHIDLRPRSETRLASAALRATTPAPAAPPVTPKLLETASVPVGRVIATKVPPAAPPVTAKPLETASVPVPRVIAPKVSAAAPPVAVVNRAPAVAAPLTEEIKDAPSTDVHNTLPPAGNSPQVAAAPTPDPPSETPESLRAEHAARLLTPGKEASPQAAQGTPPGNVTSAGDEKPKYTGEPISLNLKEVDLKDFFRLIHEISGLNIIIDPNVSGTVTLVLDSVPWDQALDIVMKNNRLGRVMEGNVLRIARIETLTAEQESTTKLTAARLDAAPLVTVFQPINYAKATVIATLLKSWAGGGALSRRGTVLVDERSNTVIVSDVQTQIPIIQSIIAKLDRKAKQVVIESRIVLATADFTRQLQSALTGNLLNKSGSTLIGGTTGLDGSIRPTTTTLPVAGSLGQAQTLLPGTATGFGNAVISNASARYFIDAIITAQEERDQAKTISRPTIVTQNNVKGMVQQGTQVPVETTINNTITVNYVDATLRLDVTPQITDDGNVFMDIKVQNSSVGALVVSAAPNINTQQATTQVLVPDGGTVVFGGITVTTRSKNATYVPWVGSIPILGHLFKSSNVSDNDLELLFFVSPKILIS
jgi:type IV pilus assembly protein PilQ